jgi:hypothetical protein
LLHLRIGEYLALIEAADLTGHYAVGVLLESCLAEEAAFIERTRQLIRKRVALGLAAAAQLLSFATEVPGGKDARHSPGKVSLRSSTAVRET